MLCEIFAKRGPTSVGGVRNWRLVIVHKCEFTKIHVRLTLHSLYREWSYANVSSIGDNDA